MGGRVSFNNSSDKCHWVLLLLFLVFTSAVDQFLADVQGSVCCSCCFQHSNEHLLKYGSNQVILVHTEKWELVIFQTLTFMLGENQTVHKQLQNSKLSFFQMEDVLKTKCETF